MSGEDQVALGEVVAHEAPAPHYLPTALIASLLLWPVVLVGAAVMWLDRSRIEPIQAALEVRPAIAIADEAAVLQGAYRQGVDLDRALARVRAESAQLAARGVLVLKASAIYERPPALSARDASPASSGEIPR